jgi:hypothetical protein
VHKGTEIPKGGVMKANFTRLLLFCCAAVLLSPPLTGENPGYMLKCRAGGEMSGKLEDAGNVYILYITFRKARDFRNLQPGECAWMDRVIKADEPAEMFWWESSRPINIGVEFGHVWFYTVHNQKLRALLNAIEKGETFYVWVRNKGKLFEIAKLGK